MQETDLMQITWQAQEQAPVIYRPTAFWEQAANELMVDLKMVGLDNVRNSQAALKYFVPRYQQAATGLDAELVKKLVSSADSSGEKAKTSIKRYTSGEQLAHSDYRTLMATELKGKNRALKDFSESTFGNPSEQFQFSGKRYSRAALNYLLGLAFVSSNTDGWSPQVTMEIGGGFGSLGEITAFMGGKYIGIDIAPTCVAAWHYLKHATNKTVSFANGPDEKPIEKLADVSILPAQDMPTLRGQIDLFVNFISFQEMEPDVVSNYAKLIKRHTPAYILLRNLREGKQVMKPGAIGVRQPTRRADYLEMFDDYELIAEDSEIYGYTTLDGFHSELLLLRKKEQ